MDDAAVEKCCSDDLIFVTCATPIFGFEGKIDEGFHAESAVRTRYPASTARRRRSHFSLRPRFSLSSLRSTSVLFIYARCKRLTITGGDGEIGTGNNLRASNP